MLQNDKLARVIAKALANESFKQQLKEHPHQAFKSAGVEVPSNIVINVLEDSENQVHVVLPTSSEQIKLPNIPGIKAILEKTLKDSNFKQQLIHSPNATLEEMGIQLKNNRKIVILENNLNLWHFVLPYINLHELAGGKCQACNGGFTCSAVNPASGCED